MGYCTELLQSIMGISCSWRKKNEFAQILEGSIIIITLAQSWPLDLLTYFTAVMALWRDLSVFVCFILPPSPSWGAGSARSVWRRRRGSGCGRGFYFCCIPTSRASTNETSAETGICQRYELITLKKTITALNSHFHESCFHLEAADEVVSGEELVKDELERVVTARLVQSKYIKRPLIHILRRNTETNSETAHMLSELFL